MNQLSQITIPLVNLFAPEVAPEANNADPMAIAIQVARRYSFLPLPVLIQVEGDRIILKHLGASDHAQMEAERLASRAAKHAGNGDCQRAIGIWLRVLQLVPADLVARRDIGMASSELGNFAQAKHYLSEALLIDADDIGSLVALASIAVKQNDYAMAEGLRPQGRVGWAPGPLGLELPRRSLGPDPAPRGSPGPFPSGHGIRARIRRPLCQHRAPISTARTARRGGGHPTGYV